MNVYRLHILLTQAPINWNKQQEKKKLRWNTFCNEKKKIVEEKKNKKNNTFYVQTFSSYGITLW